MNYYQTGYFLAYTITFLIMVLLASKGKMTVIIAGASFMVLFGYLIGVPFYSVGILDVAVLGMSSIFAFNIFLKDGLSLEGMMSALAVVTLITNFAMSFLLLGSFSSIIKMPDWTSIFNVSSSVTYATNKMGGFVDPSLAFGLGTIWNDLIWGFSQAFGILNVLYNILIFIGTAFIDIGKFVIYPESLIPWQSVRLLVETFLAAIVAIFILSRIKVFGSGMSSA